MSYNPKYKKQFLLDVKKYSGMKKQIEKKVLNIIKDPYHNSELLEKRGKFDLRGLRSFRIDRNFRIIFAICDECSEIFSDEKENNPCKLCDDSLPEKTIIFFTVRPHKNVYKNQKPLG